MYGVVEISGWEKQTAKVVKCAPDKTENPNPKLRKNPVTNANPNVSNIYIKWSAL